MEEIIIELVNEFGYLGILFLVAIENVFPPIPSEIILTFGGFLTTYTSKIRRQTSSSSGGGGGGSSFHRSSSGRSHGGGGRRF